MIKSSIYFVTTISFLYWGLIYSPLLEKIAKLYLKINYYDFQVEKLAINLQENKIEIKNLAFKLNAQSKKYLTIEDATLSWNNWQEIFNQKKLYLKSITMESANFPEWNIFEETINTTINLFATNQLIRIDRLNFNNIKFQWPSYFPTLIISQFTLKDFLYKKHPFTLKLDYTNLKSNLITLNTKDIALTTNESNHPNNTIPLLGTLQKDFFLFGQPAIAFQMRLILKNNQWETHLSTFSNQLKISYIPPYPVHFDFVHFNPNQFWQLNFPISDLNLFCNTYTENPLDLTQLKCLKGSFKHDHELFLINPFVFFENFPSHIELNAKHYISVEDALKKKLPPLTIRLFGPKRESPLQLSFAPQ